MGFLAGLFLSGMVIFGIYRYATDEAVRRKVQAELLAQPVRLAATIVGLVFFIAFFWGIIIPKFGSIPISIGSVRLPLWQVGGIGTLGWLLFWYFGPRSA